MKSKGEPVSNGDDLQKLSLSIGNFIRYWGFRRIHGAIWTQLYLHNIPMSCTDLTQALGLSKALISPALEELCQHQLIREVPSPNEKTKLYKASEKINEVIKHVLRTRESKILKQITRDFSEVKQLDEKKKALDEARLKSLEEMILAANVMLEFMLAQEDLLGLPMKNFKSTG